jgi:hypothetical protein
MNFLSKFKTVQQDESVVEELPARRRTFSATQFREEELARAAAVRAEQEAADAEAAAAAEEARAQRMADAEAERAEYGDPYGEELELTEPASPPMDWEEAVGWLSQRSGEARSLVAQNWNWEHDLRVLQFLVAQPDVDMGVAAGVFWLTGATEDFFPWGDDEEPADEQYRRARDMVMALGKRFNDDDFTNRRFGFDDSWDCSGLKERLETLYMDERIEWSPGNIPTASPGAPMTLDDVPAEEQADVADFLRRHGA